MACGMQTTGQTASMTSDAPDSADPGGLRRRLMSRRSAVIAVARRHGAHNVRVFGSVARGEHSPTSDTDLLVDFEAGVGLFEMAALVDELKELLEADVDVVSSGSLRPWNRDVLDEAIPL